jgi:hypothetical protein
VVWNFIATHSLSKTSEALAEVKLKSASAKSTAQEFAKIKSEVTHLQEKERTIEKIDSKIDVANVLAEISFLVDKRIVLSKVEFITEKFEVKQDGKPNSDSNVRTAYSTEQALPYEGNIRFKVQINGIASDASDVAAFICRLEESPYFCQVIPLYTRNKEMKTASKAEADKLQVSEFEISCYLANYRQDRPYSAKADKFAEEIQKGKAAAS